MKIGIIVAMEKEFKQLKTLLDESRTEQKNKYKFVIGEIGNNQVFMQQCGIGKVNSAIGAVEMINNYHPDLIISTGVAGGVDVEMNPLDVVVGTQYHYHDLYCGSEVEYGQLVGMPPYFTSPQKIVERALNVKTDNKIYSGIIVSGDWFVDSKEKMQAIVNSFPQAIAVDMESCSIAHTCYLYDVPFLSFRLISDIPLKDEKAAQYFDFWDRMADGSFQVTKQLLLSF